MPNERKDVFPVSSSFSQVGARYYGDGISKTSMYSAVCTDCGERHSIEVNPGVNFNVRDVRQWLNVIGWQANPVLCPRCIPANPTSVPRKLTPADVVYIKRSRLSGVELAQHYGVTKQVIYRIRNGEIWKGVEE